MHLAQGRTPSISTAQLLQLLYEVGVVDRSVQVGDLLNKLMCHGFYRSTNPQKRDSYGPMPPPHVGLDECQRWALVLLLERLKQQERDTAAGISKVGRRGV